MAAYLPLAVLLSLVAWFGSDWQGWVLTWAVGGAMFAGFKWLSYVEAAGAEPRIGRTLAYFLAWPGMDADAFLAPARRVARPPMGEWLAAVGKTAVGVALAAIAAARVESSPMVAGWMFMAGIIMSLHFGLFHLLSLVWRAAGIDAVPIMNAPILAESLGDFWGRRWNLAFRDLSHAHAFRPLAARFGPAVATLVVFAGSGVLHELVISFPAGAGYGLPTLYFLIQAGGLFLERGAWGRRAGLRRGLRGRIFCAAVVLLPVNLLFHSPFVHNVVLPMLDALRAP